MWPERLLTLPSPTPPPPATSVWRSQGEGPASGEESGYQWGEGIAGHGLSQQPSAGPQGPSPTSGSRCRCIITSAPLAFLDYAAGLSHLQQYPASSTPFDFL